MASKSHYRKDGALNATNMNRVGMLSDVGTPVLCHKCGAPFAFWYEHTYWCDQCGENRQLIKLVRELLIEIGTSATALNHVNAFRVMVKRLGEQVSDQAKRLENTRMIMFKHLKGGKK